MRCSECWCCSIGRGRSVLEWIANNWVELLFGEFAAGFTWAYRRLAKRVRDEIEDHRATKLGMQSLLRDRLIGAHAHYKSRGSITYHGLEAVLSMYEAYHTLGGNGTVTTVIEEIKELPVVED